MSAKINYQFCIDCKFHISHIKDNSIGRACTNIKIRLKHNHMVIGTPKNVSCLKVRVGQLMPTENYSNCLEFSPNNYDDIPF